MRAELEAQEKQIASETMAPLSPKPASSYALGPGAKTILGAVTVVAATGLANFLMGFKLIISRATAIESWVLGSLLLLICVIGASALFIAIVRTRDLRREIELREQAERRALQLAHDPLCGLPNRQLLTEELVRAIAEQMPFSVLLVDLDRFKAVNDLYGHEVGDRLLAAAAERLRLVDPRVFVARLGGDEFVCISRHANDQSFLSALASSYLERLHEPFIIAGRTFKIGATIGISSFPDNCADAKGLLRSADLAMYCAKHSGRGAYAFFDHELREKARDKAELEVEVFNALAKGEIKPYFQPILDLQTGDITGFEALARWHHPARGVIGPASFIPLIENLGLQDQLLEVVVDGAALAARSWPGHASLAVNVSAIQLQDPLFPARLVTLLHHKNFPPKRLIVDVTEEQIAGHSEPLTATFSVLRAAGIRMALDDFGKSYSNLSWLRELRFDHLKIHGSLLRTADDPGRNVLHAVVALTKELGVPAQVQGVETADMAELVRSLGCTYAQGFHFGPAVPAEQIADKMSGYAKAASYRTA